MPEIAFVALGSNLGDRAAYLAAARSAIALVCGVTLRAASRVEETAPLTRSHPERNDGFAPPIAGAPLRPQGPYLNQMIAVETTLEPAMLLTHLQRIETKLGRIRTVRWGSRTIDLDIVRFGDRTLSSRALTLPHPGLADRVFWRDEATELNQLLGATK